MINHLIDLLKTNSCFKYVNIGFKNDTHFFNFQAIFTLNIPYQIEQNEVFFF